MTHGLTPGGAFGLFLFVIAAAAACLLCELGAIVGLYRVVARRRWTKLLLLLVPALAVDALLFWVGFAVLGAGAVAAKLLAPALGVLGNRLER